MRIGTGAVGTRLTEKGAPALRTRPDVEGRSSCARAGSPAPGVTTGATHAAAAIAEAMRSRPAGPMRMGTGTVGTRLTENGACGRSSLFRSSAASAAGVGDTAHGPDEINQLRSEINQRFSEMNRRLDSFDERLCSVEIAFAKVDQRLEIIERVVLPDAPAPQE